MQLEQGSATVPVALFGVSPNSWCSRFHSPLGALRRVLPARRRDPDGSSRDDCAAPSVKCILPAMRNARRVQTVFSTQAACFEFHTSGTNNLPCLTGSLASTHSGCGPVQ